MARLENLSKTLGCRLLLLLFWTVFVCCVLYARRGSQLSDGSSDYLKGFPSERLKRFSGSSYGDRFRQAQCVNALDTPTQEEGETLKRMFATRRRKAPTEKTRVHCSVISLCRSVHQKFHADCFSNECTSFKVRVKRGDHVTGSLSSRDLSDVVATSLGEHSFMSVDDLNRYIDVHCEDPAVSKMEISGDVTPGSNCQRPQRRSDFALRKVNFPPKKNIHILYFRFLSQWELPVRFPGLFNLLETAGDDRKAKVMKFSKHQATKWGDDETLSLLIQGRLGPFKSKDSLLETVRQAGYCFRLDDLSCTKSKDQELLLSNVTSTAGALCEDNPLRHREAMMERLCAEGNLTESKTRSLLTSLLSNVHELDGGGGGSGGGGGGSGGGGGDSRPVLSLSVMNTKDFKNSDVLDAVLRNVFVSLLSGKNRVVMVVGGVGNPAFLTFDQKARLHAQASNPAMVLVSAGNMSLTNHNELRNLNQSLFSMLNVHRFVKKLLVNENNASNSLDGNNTPISQNQNNTPMSRDTPRDNETPISREISPEYESPNSCASLHVEPPFTCLCEEQFVVYENDTLMAGFVEFAVGIINSKLQHSSASMFSASSPQKRPCATLAGVSFSNVRVGRVGQKKRIVLDVVLEDDVFRDRVVRRAVLDVWDVDTIPKADVNFIEPDSSSPTILVSPKFQNDRFLKTLCRSEESLDFHTTSETSVLHHWGQERHLGLKATVLHVHDNCLYMFVRDFGDSVGVEAANLCRDRRYDVMMHLSLMNMISLSPLPLSVGLGHAQRAFLTAIVKISYTVPTFAYKLHPDFEVSYDT